MASIVFKEEGVAGFFRGITIPLVTISAVREYRVHLVLSLCFKTLIHVGAASFTIYTDIKVLLHAHQMLDRPRVLDVALAAGIGGAASGAVISCGSTRKSSDNGYSSSIDS